MTTRQLWVKLRLNLHEFQHIERHSLIYENLILSGVEREKLDEYITSGRGRKRQDCQAVSTDTTIEQVRELVRLGGSVSGGAALRAWLGLEGSRDYDVFFPDISSFVKAHLATYDNPNIDICLYENQPYELFDLSASKCSYSASGFATDSSFNNAMITGISDIELAAVVHPLSTLRRVIKYGSKYNLKFPFEKVFTLIDTYKVDEDISMAALNFAV